LTRRVSVGGAYQLQHTNLLDVKVDPQDQALIDRVFTELRLSSFTVQGFYDTRDDPVDSTAGEYLSVSGQIAARSIGSEVGFAKSFFTAGVSSGAAWPRNGLRRSSAVRNCGGLSTRRRPGDRCG
jgi:hypothetical protein